MASILHRFPDAGPFERRVRLAELGYVAASLAAAQTLAENYVGLPYRLRRRASGLGPAAGRPGQGAEGRTADSLGGKARGGRRADTGLALQV